MLSYRMIDYAGALEPFSSADPEPRGDEVVVRVTACGVCHSDVHLRDGFYDHGDGKHVKLPRGVADLPHVLGHEIVGEVAAVGPGATSVRVGDRRIVYPWIGCGACDVCLAGNEILCVRPRTIGISLPGGYATHVVVPHERYLVDPGDLSDGVACTLACSGLTAYGALRKVGSLGERDTLLIVGAGGVGLAAIGLARAVTGVAPVVVDIDPAKREAALAAGARDAIDGRELDASTLIKRSAGRFAAAIDFVGAEPTAKLGFDVLRMGGTLVCVGLFGGALRVPLPLLPLRVLTLRGSYVGSLAELHGVVALARAGDVRAVPIETRPLARAEATLEDLKAGRILGRVVLAPSGGA